VKLSIVTSLYHSARYLEEFHRRTSAAAAQVTDDFELVLVNDGSPDDSLEVAVRLHRADPRVRVIDLARNFGHHKALMTGLAHARGDLIFLIDADLEEEPELLPRFHAEMQATGAEVIYGVQARRKGDWFERLSGWCFYRLFNLLSSHPIPANLITARLMTRRYVAALLLHRESEVFLGGVWAITGFRQLPLQVVKHSHGHTTYNLWRRLALLVNAITSFSSRPLRMVFYLGALIFLVSSLAAAYLVCLRLFVHGFTLGWPSVVVSIWMIDGLTIFCIGVVGIYVSKIFTESKRRPYTIVRDIYERAEEPESHVVHPHPGFSERLLHSEAPREWPERARR